MERKIPTCTECDPAREQTTLRNAIFDANLKDQEEGGHGNTPTVGCLPPGMPRQMNVYEPMQIVITADIVHMLIEHVHDSRRIYTDGRSWPKEMEPMFSG